MAPVKPENTKSQAQKVNSLADFTVLGTLGKGSFGEVRLVRHQLSGELFALK